jgi:arylsulfatase A-like enzyme
MKGLLSILTAITLAGFATAKPPNVIVILVDDMGYGDIAAHGNPVIRTPHLDKLSGESAWLTDFHVDPTCSPTRSALLTGRYPHHAAGPAYAGGYRQER